MVTIKAKWTSNLPSFYTITYMQEMTSTVCNSVNTPSASATTPMTASDYTNAKNNSKSYVPQSTLSDARDGKQYIIRKYADGYCWMAQNLDYDLNKNTPLKNTDSNLTSKSSWTPDESTGTSLVYWGPKDGTYPTVSKSYSPSSSHSPSVGQIGNFYNIMAATADSSKVGGSGGYAPDSICPKGFRMPGYTDKPGFHGGLRSVYDINTINTSTLFSLQQSYSFYDPEGSITSGSYGGNGFYATNFTQVYGVNYGPSNSSTNGRTAIFVHWAGGDNITYTFAPTSMHSGFHIRCLSID